MIELYSPDTESELLILRSVLDDAGIPHFVHNDTFGSMVAGPRIAHYNRKRILVPETDYEDALDLVSEYLLKTEEEPQLNSQGLTLADKLRMVLELLLFGWFMPGKRFQATPKLELVKGFQTESRDDVD